MRRSTAPLPGSDAAQPQSAPFPWPRPNPLSSAVSWLSGFCACQQLWENVLHIMTMQKTCQKSNSAHMYWGVLICNSLSWATSSDTHWSYWFCPLVIYPPWARHAAAQQAPPENQQDVKYTWIKCPKTYLEQNHMTVHALIKLASFWLTHWRTLIIVWFIHTFLLSCIFFRGRSCLSLLL